jgi:branched-subunit amino acid aminotransferase/4-amino-4-deoxychorismate lyase
MTLYLLSDSERILDGITRKSLIDMAKEGINVEVRPVWYLN